LFELKSFELSDFFPQSTKEIPFIGCSLDFLKR
jgi:hypothetical protein